MGVNFELYPFEKTRKLLNGSQHKNGLKHFNVSIGEPQFPTPKIIIDEIAKNSALFSKYPSSGGEKRLVEAQIGFVKRRFNIDLNRDQLLPTLGTREALFNFPQSLLFGKNRPKIAYPDPFYQIYEGAAKACGAEITPLVLEASNNFIPDIDAARHKRLDLVILNSPNNPTGSEMDFETLKEWAALSRDRGFTLLNDECYSEIYRVKRPASLLEAAKAVGNADFKNIIVMNSLSKRSSAAGVRSGFVAGDAEILRDYARYRSYAGCAAGAPLQLGAAAAWEDDDHAEKIRLRYAKNMDLAEKTLGVKAPNAAFYLWLEAKDDLEAARRLYENYALTALCGSFLSRSREPIGYLRVALVYGEDETIEILSRLREFLSRGF